MNLDLPHVAIVLKDREIAPVLLTSLRKLTGQSLGDIRAAVATHRPVVQEELFSNGYFDDGISRLRTIVALLQNSDVGFEIYEIREGESYETSDLGACRITPETLENILTGS